LSAGGASFSDEEKTLYDCLHNSARVLDVLSQEAEALNEAIQKFEELSCSSLLPSEISTIKETKSYLKRRRQLVLSMKQLLECAD